jgi:exopolysaccharide biosynthesis polyprenyl glycosylphosphotransferase
MSEPINLSADAALRRLLEHPARQPRQGRTLATIHAVRIGAAIADAAQIAIIGPVLCRLFPAAAETFSTLQCLGLAGLAAVLAAATRSALRSPGRSDIETVDTAASRAALATFLAVVLVAAICWVTLSQATTPNPRGRTAWFIAWAIASSLAACGLQYVRARLAERLDSGRRVVIVGSPESADPVARLIETAPRSLWRLAASFDDRAPGALDAGADIIARGGADVVVLAISGPDTAARVAAVCDRLADQPVRVSLAFDSSTLAGIPQAAASLAGLPLLDIANDPHGGLGGLAKRWMDIGLGTLAIVLTGPLILLVMTAIRLESPGPLFFRQWRFGLGSQPILVLKFRTMRTEELDPTGARHTLARDPRVTRVGRLLRRTSIDELPQLLNVLRGDMSLVGPRPHPLHMRVGDAYYFEAVAGYRARHLIRPGITGWAQINGSRGAVDALEKARRRVELDLFYIKNWSLWLDLRILFATAFGGFLSSGAD